MDDVFADIKSALDIQTEITRATGFSMKGKHLEECPFCNGHGCFSIMKDKQAYKCHQCDAKGDIFTFIEEYEKLDKKAALLKAAGLAGITLKDRAPAKAVNMTVKERIFKDAMEYYHALAIEGPGIEYFVKRRGHDEKVMATMKLGYSDGKLVRHLEAKKYDKQDLIESGLIKEREQGNGDGPPKKYLADLFAPDLAIFPHFDPGGKVVHFTMKDPDKKRALSYQLPAAARSRDWKFYNQRALGGDTVILVEGENDLLAVMSAGYSNVMATTGQISEAQLAALQSNMKHKDLYLWFDDDGKHDDGDKLGKGGKGYTEKVCKYLKSASYGVRIIDTPGTATDPDEFLKGNKAELRQSVEQLMKDSQNYLHWQIKIAGLKGDLGEKLDELKKRKIFSAISALPRMERSVIIDKLKAMGFDEEAIKEALEVNKELRDTLGQVAADAGGIQKADVHKVVRVIYEHFEANGKFFKDREHNVYLLYENYIYTIGTNRPFSALMQKSSGLIANKQPGPVIWEGLANHGYIHGTDIDLASWIHTDIRRRVVYVNFNSSDNTILRISGKGIEEVPNGLNEDDVLLKSSDKIRTMEYNDSVQVREGLEALKNLVLDNMTCDLEQRYLVICWLISAFLLDFMPYQVLMKFSVSTESGKTTAAKLFSYVLYGGEEMGSVSPAAAYSLSSQNPLLVLDNLEEANRGKSIKEFMLLAATGGSKSKRAGGTDSDTVQEKPKSLVLITAIEPLEEPELINRTMDIEFHKKHKSDEFIESLAEIDILDKRDEIVSAILKLIQKDVLPNMDKGIRDNLAVLKKSHKGHAKSRADEYLALLMLILEKILPHMPLHGLEDFEAQKHSAAGIWGAWIDYQNRVARDDETQSNSILKMLDGMTADYLHKMRLQEANGYTMSEKHDHLGKLSVIRYTHDEYLLPYVKTQAQLCEPDDADSYHLAYVQFECSSSELVKALDAYCKSAGTKNSYTSAARLMKRLANDMPTLQRAMWELVVPDKDKYPYVRTIQGQRRYLFRKTLVR